MKKILEIIDYLKKNVKPPPSPKDELISLMDNCLSKYHDKNPVWHQNINVMCQNNYQWTIEQAQFAINNFFYKTDNYFEHTPSDVVVVSIIESIGSDKISELIFSDCFSTLKSSNTKNTATLDRIKLVIDSFHSVLFKAENLYKIDKIYEIINEKLIKYKKKSDRYSGYDKKLEEIIQKFSYYSKSIRSEHLKDLAKKTQLTFLEDSLAQSAKKIMSSKKIDHHDLSVNAISSIENIKRLYSQLLNKKQSWTSEQDFLIKKIIDERLPETLEKFLSLDPTYRSTMKTNDGKTPETLLEDSLLIIKNKFESISKQLNGEIVTDMKIQNNYLKSI